MSSDNKHCSLQHALESLSHNYKLITDLRAVIGTKRNQEEFVSHFLVDDEALFMQLSKSSAYWQIVVFTLLWLCFASTTWAIAQCIYNGLSLETLCFTLCPLAMLLAAWLNKKRIDSIRRWTFSPATEVISEQRLHQLLQCNHLVGQYLKINSSCDLLSVGNLLCLQYYLEEITLDQPTHMTMLVEPMATEAAM